MQYIIILSSLHSSSFIAKVLFSIFTLSFKLANSFSSFSASSSDSPGGSTGEGGYLSRKNVQFCIKSTAMGNVRTCRLISSNSSTLACSSWIRASCCLTNISCCRSLSTQKDSNIQQHKSSITCILSTQKDSNIQLL